MVAKEWRCLSAAEEAMQIRKPPLDSSFESRRLPIGYGVRSQAERTTRCCKLPSYMALEIKVRIRTDNSFLQCLVGVFRSLRDFQASASIRCAW
jgi:hypothetical protein